MCDYTTLWNTKDLQWHFIQAMPDGHTLQFIDVMKLSVADVSVHASMPKEDILAFNVTQEYTNN